MLRPPPLPLLYPTPVRWECCRYSDAFAGPDVEGDVEGLPFYAGQSAGFVDEIEPAGKIVQKIGDELERTVEPGK